MRLSGSTEETQKTFRIDIQKSLENKFQNCFSQLSTLFPCTGFVQEVGARTAAPGGGSVSALVGAMVGDAFTSEVTCIEIRAENCALVYLNFFGAQLGALFSKFGCASPECI